VRFEIELTVGIGLTVIDTGLLVAGFPVAHGVAFEVKITWTIDPFVREVVVKVFCEVLPPWFTPFTCHWYNGLVPPLVGLAVKVMLCPLQMVVALGVTETLTGSKGLIVILTLMGVPGHPFAVGVMV
jgi:hypothetical protein